MYYYVYKTTNTINNKYYYGVHKSKVPLDNKYFGSGVLLRKAIEKYGEESFTKEVIEYFDTLEDAFEYERELLSEEHINSDLCYNLNIGGRGGSTRNHIKDYSWHLKPKTDEVKYKIGKSLEGKSYLTDEGRKIISEKSKGNTYKLGFKESQETKNRKKEAFAKSETHGLHLKNKSPETIEKMRKNRIGKGVGDNNSMSSQVNRQKVSESKIGLKKLISPNNEGFKMAKVGSQKWHDLIKSGYTPN